jgi:hypothetical protein
MVQRNISDTADVISNYPAHLNSRCGTQSHKNKRKEHRRRVLKAGEIDIHDYYERILCTIKNISDGGALIGTSSKLNIQGEFKLIVPRDGFSTNCKIVHSNPPELRVEFLGEKSALDSSELKKIHPSQNPFLIALSIVTNG